jgi:hypothetical protein
MVEVPRVRCHCSTCNKTTSLFAYSDMDESGCLPSVLNSVYTVGTLLPYQTAAMLLKQFGICVSKSQGHRLGQCLDQKNHERKMEVLREQADDALTPGDGQQRHWIAEVDGVIVPTIDPEKPGEVAWKELKSCILYKQSSPWTRFTVTLIGPVEEFAVLVHGLMRQAKISQSDILIGVSDAAPWIAALFGDMGVKRHILDVFHASEYLDDVMIGLKWDEYQRSVERRRLLAGEIDVQEWLNLYIKGDWSDGKTEAEKNAQKGLKYLEKQALLNHTCYPGFKAEGIEVIGSGQIEGANKSMIGARLKVSGAKWNLDAANGKGCARAEMYSAERIICFDLLRLATFPQAA